MYIIIGLGNPSDKYNGTRHNIGFDTIDRLAQEYGISLNTYKHKALCGKGNIAGSVVILAKPLTYMNLSGESVRELVNFYKADIEQEIIVVYDDISLETGQLRIKSKGSAGGHNGIKNIIAQTGTQNFYRIKIGVGPKPAQMELVNYVLGRFDPVDRVKAEEGKMEAVKAATMIIAEGIDKTMNVFNALKNRHKE